jgi:hypothetical protein
MHFTDIENHQGKGSSPSSHRYDVAIVGAGLVGLATASEQGSEEEKCS